MENATQLAIAKNIIHESLHGYLGYVYRENRNATLSQLLTTYFIDNGYNTEAGQHRLMTQFADAIGASLAAWDNHTIPEPADPEWLDINNTIAAEQDNISLTYTHPNGKTYNFSPEGSPTKDASGACN